MFRFVPWLIGVILIAVAVAAWLERRDQGTLARFIDRVQHGDEGPLERAGRKVDEAIEKTAKELRDD